MKDSLLEQNYDVYGIDDLSFGNKSNLSDRVTFFKDTVENTSSVYGKFDIIYQLHEK